MIDLAQLTDRFVALYAKQPRIFSAPGRVNLIGDHTDYNDGFAMPIAIGRRTVVAAARRSDRQVTVRSSSVDEHAAFDLDQARETRPRGWLDYVEGMARTLQSRAVPVPGADLLIDSDVPIGAGLSSSAALEMSVGLALCSLGGTVPPSRELALAGQAAEHDYVGAAVGIMDQLVAALGQADHALLIDCRSLETTQVSCALAGTSIVVCDTKVKHDLAASAYNERRRQCEAAVAALRATRPELAALRDVSVEALERMRPRLLSDTLYRRARHVVSENARTQAAVRALEAGDRAELGRLMVASHHSLRADYEVSCPELDTCVEVALAEGAFGARMTGGGFGGCTVNLVEEHDIERFARALGDAYQQRFHRAPDIFPVRASEGMKEH